MSLEREWRLKFSLIFLSFLCLFLSFVVSSCGTKSEDIPIEDSLSQNVKIFEELEKFKDVKFGLGEKFLMEGIDFLISMNYDRAIYSLNKSLFYNPVLLETKYFLAKAYLNSGKIKNAIDLFEEIKESELSSFVIPKLSSIYSRLSLSFNRDIPFEYYTLTNIYGISQNKKFFSLPTSIRYSKNKGIILSSFGNDTFLVYDDQFNSISYNPSRKIIDVVFDGDEGVFWFVDFSSVYKYSEGFFNLNFWDINIKNTFRYNNVSFRKIGLISEWIYLLDVFNNKIIVINKNDGKFLFSFSSELPGSPTDLEIQRDNVFVSFGERIEVFSKYGEFLYRVNVSKKVNGFCLFGDNFVVSSDDGIYIVSRDGKIISVISTNKFDDVVVGSGNKIYAINTEENRIECFGNIFLSVYNLDVDIKGVFFSYFPLVGVLVGVRNIQQDIVGNLKDYNFEVFESGVSIVMPEVRETYRFLKKKHLYIVIEKSKEIFDNYNAIINFVRNILEDLNASDYINVSVVGEDILEIGKTNVSILYPIDFIEKTFNTFSDNYRLLDGVYKGITELLYSVRNNAVLVITSGDLERDVSKRNIYNIIDYAYYNFIPLYVISLTNNEILRELASSTGGEYYDESVLFSHKVFLRDYENNKVFRYLVVFRSLYEVKYPDSKLVDLEIRVRYNNLFGKDKIKYIFPKIKKAVE
ncbi:MAG: hypothetical protein ACK4F9_00805 [Brevinematia bacterium]